MAAAMAAAGWWCALSVGRCERQRIREPGIAGRPANRRPIAEERKNVNKRTVTLKMTPEQARFWSVEVLPMLHNGPPKKRSKLARIWRIIKEKKGV